MTGIKAGIFELITAHAGAAALVAERIYPQRVPSGTPLPYIVYSRIAVGAQYHLGGSSGASRELFQFDAWAGTPAEAEALGKALREALEVQNVTAGGVLIEAIELESQRDTDEDPGDGRDLPLYGTSLDFRVWHQEI